MDRAEARGVTPADLQAVQRKQRETILYLAKTQPFITNGNGGKPRVLEDSELMHGLYVFAHENIPYFSSRQSYTLQRLYSQSTALCLQAHPQSIEHGIFLPKNAAQESAARLAYALLSQVYKDQESMAFGLAEQANYTQFPPTLHPWLRLSAILGVTYAHLKKVYVPRTYPSPTAHDAHT